jgi:hypothetical protein
LRDTGRNARSFTPTALQYSVHGLSANGGTLLFQKSSGAFNLVVWDEPDIWNEATNRPIPASSKRVTVQLGSMFDRVKVYDPLIKTAPIAQMSNVGVVPVLVKDHPLVIELTASEGARLTGTAGSDRLFGTPDDDPMLGLGGDDVLAGRVGNDSLNGGDGNDVLNGGAGADQLIGGAGMDAAAYPDVRVGLTANLSRRSNNTGEASGDTYTGIESLVGGPRSDRLIGNGAANRLAGSGGNDILRGDAGDDDLDGGDGNDLLLGGQGADQLNGGPGLDTASHADATLGAYVDLAQQGANSGGAAGDRYEDVEKLVGSGFADTILGDAAANTLAGGDGKDVLSGYAGDDVVIGGLGDDTLGGGGGDDTLVGGAGRDVVEYAGFASAYSWFRNADGSWTVRDRRSGSPGGTDRLVDVEMLRFPDRSVTISGGAAARLSSR